MTDPKDTSGSSGADEDETEGPAPGTDGTEEAATADDAAETLPTRPAVASSTTGPTGPATPNAAPSGMRRKGASSSIRTPQPKEGENPDDLPWVDDPASKWWVG